MNGDIRDEWRIREIERKAERAESKIHEVDSLRGDVDRLERTCRELSSSVDGLRTELQAYQERFERLERMAEEQEK